MTTNDPAAAPAATPATRDGRKGLWIIVGVVLALVLAGGVVFLLTKGDGDTAADAQGEIFLEPAAAPGTDPFSPPMAGAPDPAIAEPASLEPPAGVSGATTAQAGGTPGLYGGTTQNDKCDPEALIAFLEANPDKAKAWVAALNADPKLQWSGGTTVATTDIRAYVGELTSIVLVADTRVTNHGYRAGKPTVFQSVLQRGSAVLVDKYGVPRVRCFCGNPLIAPIPTKGKPTFKGEAWSGFDPAKVQVVSPNPKPVESFQVRIPAKPGSPLTTVPAGTSSTTPAPGTSSSPAPSPTAAPSSTAPASPTAAASPTAPAKGTISVAPATTHPNGDVDYAVTLSGYPPNTKVALTCASSAQPGGFYTETVTTDGSGGYFASPFCYTRDKGFVVSDDRGGSSR